MNRILIVLLICGFSFSTYAQTVSDEEFGQLLGDTWAGELMYTNYADNKPVRLPVELVITQKKSRQYRFAYTYPKEPQANRTPTIKIGRKYNSISKNPIIERNELTDGTLQIITSGVGKDNGKAATFRFIYELTSNRLIIRKEVTFVDGGDVLVRNEYQFTR